MRCFKIVIPFLNLLLLEWRNCQSASTQHEISRFLSSSLFHHVFWVAMEKKNLKNLDEFIPIYNIFYTMTTMFVRYVIPLEIPHLSMEVRRVCEKIKTSSKSFDRKICLFPFIFPVIREAVFLKKR